MRAVLRVVPWGAIGATLLIVAVSLAWVRRVLKGIREISRARGR